MKISNVLQALKVRILSPQHSLMGSCNIPVRHRRIDLRGLRVGVSIVPTIQDQLQIETSSELESAMRGQKLLRTRLIRSQPTRGGNTDVGSWDLASALLTRTTPV